MSFCLIPEVLDAVDMIKFLLSKMSRVIDTKMVKVGNIQRIITAIAISINYAVRYYFVDYQRHKRVRFGVLHDFSVDFSAAFQDAEDDDFS
jgi:hypothetical protein